MTRGSPRRLLAIIAGGLLVIVALPFLWLLALVWGETHPDWGTDASSVSWLPATASRISWYHSYNVRIFEFDMEEFAFRQWANAPLEPITRTVTARRYGDLLNRHIHDQTHPSSAAVQRGWIYDSPTQANGGGVVQIYDRDTGRAYVWIACR